MKNDPLVEILKNELQRKQSKNKSYSLRCFSRDLKLDPSNLSKILNYQKTIGSTLRLKIGQNLGFERVEIFNMLMPVVNHSNIANSDYKNHNMELFQVISEWQHYAILEYFKIKDASQKPKDIAIHLGLNLSTVNDAINRLLKVGLLHKNTDGFTNTENSSSSILNVQTSKAHRDQQIQILEGAIDALKNIPIEHRSQSSMTFAIDSKKINEAKELIKKFRRELGRFLSTSNDLDSVYQLSISLYPVTKNKIKKEF